MSAKAPEPPKEPRPAGTPAAPATATAAAATTTTAVPAAGAAPAAPAKPAIRPPAKARPPKSSAGVASGAFVVAACALLVAIGAIAVSVYSLKVAREALSKNAERAPAAAASTSPSPALAAPATAKPASASPAVQYFPEFVRAEVKIPAPSGCASVYVDVDTFAIGNLNGHEFYLSACPDPQALTLRVDRTSGASAVSSNPSPEVCGSLLAGAQSTPELVLAVRTGLTFCLLTNKADADTQHLPQRLAIVEVRDVGVDRSVTVAVSTFRVG